MEKNFTVYCLDKESFSEIEKMGFKTKFFDVKGIGSEFHEYGRSDFRRVTEAKIQIIINELKDKDSLVYTDCDVVFRHNPTEFINFSNEQMKDKEVDIVFASDNPFMTICTGFMHIKNTEKVHELFKQYFELSREYGKRGSECMYDQEIIFEILTKRFFDKHEKLIWGVYPTDFVKNGHLYWNEAETRTGNEAVVHVNFTIGEENKINRLKEANLWYSEKEVTL
ncbi:hypothetical protein HN662_02220 [Candidatus Woesearchaeota archaeon]|nr:hypothetical protein [Candidatus Woesearchaeota archaeon]